jgi:hypothetical protein
VPSSFVTSSSTYLAVDGYIVPIKSAAQELSLPVHEIDTFTGWNVSLYPDSCPASASDCCGFIAAGAAG